MADALVHTAEKALRDAGDKVGDDIKKDVEEKITTLKTARNGDDAAAIKSATQALSDSMMKIGEAMKTANDNAKTAENEQQATESEDTKTSEGNEGTTEETK
jgi:molecular chaperone DnaK